MANLNGTYKGALPQDANGKVLGISDFLVAKKVMTFAGGTTNDPGDLTGTGNPATLFTVTGTILVRIFGICSTGLSGNTATLSVGVTGDTASLIALSTATDLIANEVWLDATPTTKAEAFSNIVEKIFGNGQDIIQTVGTADITAGVIEYYCLWRPISTDAEVVAA